MKEKQKKDKRFSKLTLLKKSKTEYADLPENAKLEVFENLYSDRDYEITFDCPEFTSLCPVTGQPDFGEITIKYIPDKHCIESKSLKLHLFSYRNHNTFHEEAVNMILDSLVAACKPRCAEVLGKFRPRGGIAINVKANYSKSKNS
jgi:7-cyano-7-deazaguanine reductase